MDPIKIFYPLLNVDVKETNEVVLNNFQYLKQLNALR